MLDMYTPPPLGAEKGGGIMKYLFDLPPHDLTRKPYTVGSNAKLLKK